jgi:hypothetical protein
MSLLGSILAINWEPELRGLLIVIISVAVLCGSVYLILGTNLGVRLGFLVALAGLFGWLAMMGVIWAIYGIGLQGPLGSWQPVPGRTVIQDTQSLSTSGVLERPVEVSDDMPYDEQAVLVAEEFEAEGWEPLDPSSPEYGQAFAAAQVYIEEEDALEAGTYGATAVYDIGGERYPKINESLDFLAFLHEPRYVIVEVAPYEETRDESGRAPASNIIDNTQQRQYVYMVRDLGARRQPALVLAIGGGIIFLSLCWLMHRRDLTVRRNLAAPAPAG